METRNILMASQAVKCRDGPVPHPSLAFQLKCERESEKLRARFRKQLQNDMLQLFQEKTFADLTIIAAEDQQRISAHSSLLKVRAPRFYNQCLATLDNCITQPTRIVELPGLNGTQLHKFIRTVYCGEETEEEEISILNLLLSRAEIASLNTGDRLNVKNTKKTANREEIIESQKMDTTDSSNHRVAYGQPNDNDGNYEGEEYSSFSEGLNCNGTLADLTDPFSASISDVMNVSTLNANDDVSILSAEEVVGSEAFDTSEPFQVENTDPPVFWDVENIPCLEADQVRLSSAEKNEVVCGSSTLSFDLEANLMEATGPAAVEDNRSGAEDFGSDVCQGTNLEIEVSIRREEEEMFEVIGCKSLSDDYEKLTLNAYAGMKVATDENHLMARSNESKDGDSGVCCSVSRKLSTSSSCGHHSPCFSEHLQDSPTGSLPKDDSLEFCPDSLTSDETPHAMQSSCRSDPLMDLEWNMNAAYQLDLTKEGVKRRFVAGFLEDREVAPKKQAWPDEVTLEAVEQRRWSTSSCEGQLKSILKPSAVVPPYNADDDVETTTKSNVGKDTNTTFSVVHPSPQAVQWFSGTTNTIITQGQHTTDIGPAKRSVQLDFVPFLEEFTANNINKDSKPLHHVAAVEICDGSSLDAESLLNTTTHSDDLATKGLPPVTDADVVSGLGERDHVKEFEFVTNLEVTKSIVNEQLGADVITTQNQSESCESSVLAKEEITKNWVVDFVPAKNGSKTGESSFLPHEEIQVFGKDFPNGESEKEMPANVPQELDDNSESHAQKPEGYFVFIDVSDQKPPTNENGNEEGAGNTESPRKKTPDAFFFIPSDDRSVDAEKQCQPLNPPITAAAEEHLVPKTVIATTAHQPIYMYIEATSPTSSTNSGHSTRSTRPGDRMGPILRRRARATTNAQRPKSESSATLLVDASNILSSEKSSKRASLAFGEQEDATYSMDSASKEEPVEEVRIASPDKWCSKLGRDLLRMFLDGIDPDLVIRVDSKDIKAHKSILISRCVYFAAMLSGGWVESTGNVIKMQGFSYNAVHFALCHIYGGSTCVPDNIEISELASLADMLGLEGLKEVVTLALKMKYCHFFHKPCSTCTTSVSECLLIATSFCLDELQEKCLKWITRHMMKAWPTKAFAALPDEILQKCYCSAKMEIEADTVLDTLLRCDKLMATLPHVKWTEPVFSLTSRLTETASAYLAMHFPSVLSSNSFLALRSGQSWSIHALETTFLLAIDRLPLDCACQAYVRLHSLLNAASEIEVMESADINENFDALLSKIHRQVELFLIHNANRIVRCNSWSLLTPDLQKKIKDAAVIVFEFGKPTAPPPQLSSLNRKFTRTRASNSTSSASPTIERARISSSTTLFHASARGGATTSSGQKKVDANSLMRDSNSGVKAATLPRTKEVARKATPHGSQQSTIAESKETAKNHHHTGSHTLPLTKTSDIRKKVESSLNRRPSASWQAAQSSRNVQSCKAASSDSSSAGPARPKSWPVRDKPRSATVSRSKDKTPVRESPREAKPSTTNRVMLRSSARQSTLTNGNSKPTTPTAPRPKSAVYNSGAGLASKQACHCSVRDSKASNLRKAASSDLQGKENIDEIRPRSSTRPRSDDVSSPVGRRAGLRPASTRTSRLTTTSKP